MKFNVKVRRIIENGTTLKAVCSVTLDEQYVVHGVKVIKNERGNFVAMPYESFKDKEGNDRRRDIFHPITPEARLAMDAAVMAAYEAERAANENN